jgi:hypothetical protein
VGKPQRSQISAGLTGWWSAAKHPGVIRLSPRTLRFVPIVSQESFRCHAPTRLTGFVLATILRRLGMPTSATSDFKRKASVQLAPRRFDKT